MISYLTKYKLFYKMVYGYKSSLTFSVPCFIWSTIFGDLLFLCGCEHLQSSYTVVDHSDNMVMVEEAREVQGSRL